MTELIKRARELEDIEYHSGNIKTMRSVEQIQKDIANIARIRENGEDFSTKDEAAYWAELFLNITDGIPLSGLSTLCDAWRGGRCIITPIKVGDKVKVRCDTWGNIWNFKTYEYGKFLHGEIISIIRTKKQTLMKIQVEHNVSWKHERKRYPISAIGITVFPIESAEAALQKGETE